MTDMPCSFIPAHGFAALPLQIHHDTGPLSAVERCWVGPCHPVSIAQSGILRYAINIS